MMCYGITHCSVCLEPYNDRNECACTRKKEKEEREKLNLLLNMTIDEIKALKALAVIKEKDLKRQDIEEQIKRLQKQLEN